MSDLTGQLISNTYKQVILVSSSTSNTGVNTSLKAVQTGDGTNTALKVATNAVQITGALGVTGNVSLDANLHVDDKVCASAFYGDGSNLSGVTASIGGNISVSNATVGGNLYVGGTATVAGAAHLQSTVSVGGAAQFGSTVTVSGATQLQSTVTAVGAATFKSTVTVENAAILKNNVSVGGTFAVAGAATFTSKTEFDNDVSVSGRLDVASSVCVGGIAKFASDVSVSGNLNVVNNVTAAFFYGDGSNLTNVEAELGIATNISVSGFIHAGGSVSVSGPFNVVGAATFKSNVSVSGNSNFTGTVTVGGAVSLASSLSVGGAANFASTVTIAGTNLQATNARVCASAYYGDGSNLTNVPISGNISVNNATVGGNLHVGGTVTAVGAAIFNSTVTVSGNATFKTNVSVSGNTNLGGTVTVAGAVSLASTLSVGGAANFASTVTITGAASVGGTLNVGGAFTSPGIDDNASSTALTISSADNVGVGTATPDRLFEVDEASGDAYIRLRASDTGGGADTVFENLAADNTQSNYIYFGDLDDTNIGMIRYSHANDFMSFTTNASEAMRIDSSGNVGIKTTAPGGDLHVQGDAGNQVRLYLTDGDATGVGNSLLIGKSGSSSFVSDRQTGSSLWFGTADTERMRINSSGNVGIGTSSQAEKLEVNGAIVALGAASSYTNTGLYLQNKGSSVFDVGAWRSGASVAELTFSTDSGSDAAPVERMRIDSNGNVGIGTSSPSAKIHGIVGTNWNSTNYSFIFQNQETQNSFGNTVRIIGGGGAGAGHSTSNILAVGDNDDNIDFLVRGDGNVGIGTTSPEYQLDVSGTTDPRIILQSTGTAGTDDTIFMNRIGGTSATNQIWFGDSGSAATGQIQYNHSNNAMSFHTNGGTQRVTIDSSGDVGIGTANPSVYGGRVVIAGVAVNGEQTLVIANNSTNQFFRAGINANVAQVAWDDADDLAFGTASNSAISGLTSEYMRIDSSGNVGIGTSSPAKQLHITKAAKADIGTLTDGATITPDFDANQNFSVTLGGNRTLANPSNIDAGQTGSIFVVQDGTGSRTLSFGSYWKFAGGTAPTLSTAGGSVDRIDYIVYTSTAIHAVATLNIS